MTFHTSLTLYDLREALDYVDPSNRDTWVKMAMAIKSEFGATGFDAWDDWSSLGHGYKPSDAKTVWRSVKAGKGVGMGTLVYYATMGGWTPPWKRSNYQPPGAEERKRQLALLVERRLQREHEEAMAVEEDLQWKERIAVLSTLLWERYLSREGSSPYLTRKRVRAYGTRFVENGMLVVVNSKEKSTGIITSQSEIKSFFACPEKDAEHLSFRYLKRGTLVVPMRDIDGKLWGLQFIFEAGGKKFLKHGRKSGTMHTMGVLGGQNVILVAEGYATGATVHQATGFQTVIAWDAGNLLTVAKALRKKHPQIKIAICGDDDRETEGNPGRTFAEQAARAVGGVAIFPDFSAFLPEWRTYGR